MESTAKHLLFLNDLSEQTLKELNSDKKLKVSCDRLIQISEIPFDKEELDKNKTWVFTSRNAVEIILKNKINLSESIYAIGEKTASLLPNATIPKIASAHEVAKLIIKDQLEEVIFICGNRRRDELPDLLKSHAIKLKEVVVYESKNLNKTVNLQSIDGLAFMSPSSVYSLANNGGFMNLPCFAIGPTTAEALNNEGQKCLISKSTTPQSLVDVAKHYFNK
jgi:uroporphyrinogen-III synthase